MSYLGEKFKTVNLYVKKGHLKKNWGFNKTVFLIILLFTICSVSAAYASEDIPLSERLTLRFKGGYNFYSMKQLNDSKDIFHEDITITESGSGKTYPFTYDFKEIVKGQGMCVELAYSFESTKDILEIALGYERMEAESRTKTPVRGVSMSYAFPAEGLYLSLPFNLATWDIEEHYRRKGQNKPDALTWTKEEKSINWKIFWENINPDWKLSIIPSIGYYRLANSGLDIALDTYTDDTGTHHPNISGAGNLDFQADNVLGTKLEIQSEWLLSDTLTLGVSVGYHYLKFINTTWHMGETGNTGSFVDLDYSGPFIQGIVGMKF